MPETGTPAGNQQSQGTGLTPNIASLLSYICMPITSIVFILVEKENADVKFHAWQGTAFAWIYCHPRPSDSRRYIPGPYGTFLA